MTIQKMPLSSLRQPEHNVRLHTNKQLGEYVRSIQMFGQVKPIVIDDTGEIICGNGLYLALKQMGASECDCYVMEGITPKQKKKLMLADNRVYELGLMDMDVFDLFLKEMDGDSDIPGWDEDLIKTLTSSAPEVDNMISDYGVFGKDEVESLNSRQRDDYASPPQTARYEPVVQATPSPLSPVTEQSNYQPIAEEAPVQRYIICPKCGEKICL